MKKNEKLSKIHLDGLKPKKTDDREFEKYILEQDMNKNIWAKYQLESKFGMFIVMAINLFCDFATKIFAFLSGVDINIFNGLIILYFLIIISKKEMSRKILYQLLLLVDIVLL